MMNVKKHFLHISAVRLRQAFDVSEVCLSSQKRHDAPNLLQSDWIFLFNTDMRESTSCSGGLGFPRRGCFAGLRVKKGSLLEQKCRAVHRQICSVLQTHVLLI